MKIKKLALRCIVASVVFVPATESGIQNVANASDLPETNAECEEKMRERVFKEALSGKITNDEDVIKAALDQYQERIKKRSGMETPKLVGDDSLSITQVLNRYVGENRNVIENVMTTGLIVLDENNNLLGASSLLSNGNANLNDYSIYTTINVSVHTIRVISQYDLTGLILSLHVVRQ